MYNSYTTNGVFVEQQVNTLCDRLIDYVINVDDNDITKLVLTGVVALIVQGANTEPVAVIPFITDDIIYFKQLQKDINKIWPSCTAVHFADRSEIICEGVFFEIWYFKGALFTTMASGILTQNSDQVPLNLSSYAS